MFEGRIVKGNFIGVGGFLLFVSLTFTEKI